MAYFNKEQFISILNTKAEMAIGTPKSVFFSVVKMLEALPDADVEEVRHREWIRNAPNIEKMREFHKLGIGTGMSERSIYYTCPDCGMWGTPSKKYCSECGAKMDGKENTPKNE